MALLKYFKHIKPSKEERIQGVLPKPDGLGTYNANSGIHQSIATFF